MQHLDEGTIHAWLDGQLPAEKADEFAEHAGECPECAAMVAEARGLVAGSTRILTALDDIPAGVTPVRSESAVLPIVRRRWYDRTDIRVAAALLFVASASLVVARGGHESSPPRAMMTMSDNVKLEAPVAVGTATLESSGTGSQTENRTSKHDVVPAVVSPGRSPSSQKATVDAAAPAPAMTQAQAAAASAAGTPFPKLSIGSVEGRVTDQSSGKGIGGASVSLQGTPVGATTDTTGRFRIENVPLGIQRVGVRRIGYTARTIPLVVDSGTTVTAQLTLAPGPTSLGEVVVTSLAVKVDVSKVPLRVLRVDSSTAARQTVYEILPGVEVTLAETLGSTIAGNVAGISRDKTKEAMAVAATSPVPLNTISWTDRGRRYTLTARLTTKELEILKTRLMEMRR